ncbi:MAG: transposase [Actinomycetota bacterium]|nr:transposase [Actinomycetota bacterium]
MARHPRLVEPGGFYHVGSRGNDKQPIYWDRFDRVFFLTSLARVVRRYRWLVHAYCLMTNHFHLVLQVPESGLSEGMCELNTGYSRRTEASLAMPAGGRAGFAGTAGQRTPVKAQTP